MASLMRRIVSLAVLLPVLLFAVGGTTFASWRCQFDGIARSSCCCPKPPAGAAAENQAPEPGPAVSAQACCAFESSHVDKAPSDLSRSNPISVLATVVALPVAVRLPAATPPPVLPVHQAECEEPHAGWALVLRKQAFLI